MFEGVLPAVFIIRLRSETPFNRVSYIGSAHQHKDDRGGETEARPEEKGADRAAVELKTVFNRPSDDQHDRIAKLKEYARGGADENAGNGDALLKKKQSAA